MVFKILNFEFYIVLVNSHYYCLTEILLIFSCGPLLHKTVSINADCQLFSLFCGKIEHGARFVLPTFMFHQSFTLELS